MSQIPWRVSRRRFLAAGAAGVGAAAAWSLGCNGAADRYGLSSTAPPPSARDIPLLNAAAPPRPGGRYAFATETAFDGLDPHLSVAAASLVFPRIYNVLVHQSSTRPEFFVFDLAQSFETPDALTWSFKIRPGVRIAANALGVPERDLDADDVRLSLERIRDTPGAANGAFAKGFIDTVSAKGDVLTIRTKGPYAWFLNRIGIFINTIAPRELIATDGAVSRMRSAAVGGGPYAASIADDGQSIYLERNRNYYATDERNGGAKLPYIDAMELRVISERATRRAAFLSGQLQSYVPAGKGEADDLGTDDRFGIAQNPGFSYVSLVLNPERAPCNDARVRRALSRAIDRSPYVGLVYEGDARPDGLVHWPCGSYALPEEELGTRYQPFDLAECRKLAEAVGGVRVSVMYPVSFSLNQHDQHVPIFLDQMRAAGIDVEAEPLAFPVWLERYRRLDYVVSLSPNQTYETPEVPLDVHHSLGPLGDRTGAVGLGDADIDEAIARTKRTLDVEERIAAVHDAQVTIYERDPAVLNFVSPYDYTAYSRKIHNVPNGLGTTDRFLNTWWVEN